MKVKAAIIKKNLEQLLIAHSKLKNQENITEQNLLKAMLTARIQRTIFRNEIRD